MHAHALKGLTDGIFHAHGQRSGTALSAALMVAFAMGGPCAADGKSSAEDRGIAPRMLQPARDASEYYPQASLRLGEAGRVVLHFSVDADGKAVEPFTVDAGQSVNAVDRLVVAASDYLKESRFISRAPYRKMLTASFVFEFAPCGTVEHSLTYDYTINLCRDRPPAPNVPNAGIAVIK